MKHILAIVLLYSLQSFVTSTPLGLADFLVPLGLEEPVVQVPDVPIDIPDVPIDVPDVEAAPEDPGTNAAFDARNPNNNDDADGCIGQCPANNDKPVYLPHRDPEKFCQCDWGRPIVWDCPHGTCFNRHLDICDWPENCASSDTSETSESCTSSSSSSSSSDSSHVCDWDCDCDISSSEECDLN